MTTQMTTQIKTLDDKPTDNPDANPDKKTRWQHYMAAQIYTSWLSFGLSSYANPDKKKQNMSTLHGSPDGRHNLVVFWVVILISCLEALSSEMTRSPFYLFIY
jgi:hypothetical protein